MRHGAELSLSINALLFPVRTQGPRGKTCENETTLEIFQYKSDELVFYFVFFVKSSDLFKTPRENGQAV